MDTPVSRVFTACMTYEKCLCKEHSLQVQRAAAIMVTLGTFAVFLPFILITDSHSDLHWVGFVTQCGLFAYLGLKTGKLSQKIAYASAATTRASIARQAIAHSALEDEAAFIIASSGPQKMVN